MLPHDHALHDLELTELREPFRVAGPGLARDLGLAWVEEDGMALGIAAALPPSAVVVNRGLVENRPGAIAAAAAKYRAAGVSRFFLHIEGPVDAAVLEDAHLAPARPWQRFERDTAIAVNERPNEVTVRPVTSEDDRRTFAAILCDAFDLGDMARDWLRLWPDLDAFHCYVGEIGGQIASTGSLLVVGDRAMVNFGATAPAFRRRGAQSATMAHRLREAARLGCRWCHTVTGKEVPGKPQTSYTNIKRAGFTEISVCRNYAPV